MSEKVENINEQKAGIEQPIPGKTEFYIGWLPNAPTSYSRHMIKVLAILAFGIIMISIVLSVSQKKFSTATFEFGTLTQLRGVYFDRPVPCLKVVNGEDVFGNPSSITIPLVGYGKFGAMGILKHVEKEKKTSLNNRELEVKGTLLYGDGKLLMQIDSHDDPITTIGNFAGPSSMPVEKDLGETTVKGEIIDPKCYFGVMKPGEGKPHKDCAIRCISGGIPPLLHVTNQVGESNYLILVDSESNQIITKVGDLVGEPVEVRGKLIQHDDWMVLYVSHRKDISAYSYINSHFSNLVSCTPVCLR